MADRASSMQPAGPPRGILNRRAPDGPAEHQRILPEGPLAPFVAHFWWVRWALRTPAEVQTLPHPSVHVIFEEQGRALRAEVAGVCTGRFSRRLAGEGWVFGVKFRPGAFQALLGAPMVTLTNRAVPLASVFGRAAEALVREVRAAPDLQAKIALAAAFLSPRLVPLTAHAERVRDLVERMANDQSLLRVEDAASLLGLDVRALQRSFRKYVGATPKWVIQRYRLHEAAEQLKGPSPPSLAALGASLGYADQAHFARDFKLIVGQTPRAFATTR